MSRPRNLDGRLLVQNLGGGASLQFCSHCVFPNSFLFQLLCHLNSAPISSISILLVVSYQLGVDLDAILNTDDLTSSRPRWQPATDRGSALFAAFYWGPNKEKGTIRIREGGFISSGLHHSTGQSVSFVRHSFFLPCLTRMMTI